MGMFSQAGAKSCALDVKSFIMKKLEECKEEESKQKLQEIIEYCDGIVKSCDLGYY